MAINISNAQNRDAVVAVEGLLSKQEIRYVDGKGNPTGNRRILKSDSEHELPVLMKKQKNLPPLSELLQQTTRVICLSAHLLPVCSFSPKEKRLPAGNL